MNILKISRKQFLFGFIALLAFGLVLGSIALNARAQETQEPESDVQVTEAQPPQTEPATEAATKVTFPIPELGGCSTKEECRAYCNVRDHMEECTAFGKAHKLISEEQASRNKKFRERLESGGGPGGCTSPEECKVFCSKLENFEKCIAFAKEHGLKDEKTDEGERIVKFLKNGGMLPGGCTSPESCQSYCKEEAHHDECKAFAEKSGIERKPFSPAERIMIERRMKLASSTGPKFLGPPVREDVKPRITPQQKEKLLQNRSSTTERTATTTTSGRPAFIGPPVCADEGTCKKLCSDSQGQFFNHPDCVKFREVFRKLHDLEGDVPPNSDDLPSDNACVDAVTCAARCTSSESPYFLKPECIRYREENPVGYIPSPTRVFLGSMLQSFIEFFR